MYRSKVSKIQDLDIFRNSQTEKGWKSSPLVTKITYSFFWWGLFLWFEQVVAIFCCTLLGFLFFHAFFVFPLWIFPLLSQYMFQTLSTSVASGNPFRSTVGACTQMPVPALQALPEGQQKSWERDGVLLHSKAHGHCCSQKLPMGSSTAHKCPSESHRGTGNPHAHSLWVPNGAIFTETYAPASNTSW